MLDYSTLVSYLRFELIQESCPEIEYNIDNETYIADVVQYYV